MGGVLGGNLGDFGAILTMYVFSLFCNFRYHMLIHISYGKVSYLFSVTMITLYEFNLVKNVSKQC
jgi:hypothetical protein